MRAARLALQYAMILHVAQVRDRTESEERVAELMAHRISEPHAHHLVASEKDEVALDFPGVHSTGLTEPAGLHLGR